MKSVLSADVVRVVLAAAFVVAAAPSAQAAEKGLPDCRSVSYKIEVGEVTPACQLPLDATKSVGAEGPIRHDEMTTGADTKKLSQEHEQMQREFPGNTLTP